MGFFGDLVSAVKGAVAKVANVITGIASAIGSVLSNPAEAVNGAVVDILKINSDGQIDEDEKEELLEDMFKLYVGAKILNLKNEMSKEYNDIHSVFTNTLTMFNNEITALNKSAVVITDIAAAKMFSVTENIKNIWNDGFMPADLPGELAGTKMLDNPLLKGIGKVGGKIGVVATVLNPIMEYNNSLKPYEEDIEAAYEIDPENARKI